MLTILLFIISIFFPEIYFKTHIFQGWVKFGNFIGRINSKIMPLKKPVEQVYSTSFLIKSNEGWE
mgnify:CR=1 FL=1